MDLHACWLIVGHPSSMSTPRGRGHVTQYCTPRSGTVPSTDWALDVQVLREQITRLVLKNLLEFVFGFLVFF